MYFVNKNVNFNFVSFQSNNTHIRNEFFSSLAEKCNFELSGLNFNNFGVNDNNKQANQDNDNV